MTHDSIVLKGYAVRALGKIARAHPEEAEGILASLIGAREHFPNNKAGVLAEATELFTGDVALEKKVRAFVEPYARSTVASASRKARRVLKT